MAKKKAVITNAMRMLQSTKIDFEAIEYEYEGDIGDNFGETIAEIAGINPEISFKTLVVRGDKKGIMVVCIPVCCEVDLKKLARLSGDKKTEMIHVKELLGLTGYIRGGVSPIGMKKKYPTYIHSSCINNEKTAVSGGICGLTLILNTNKLISVCDATVGDITRESV